jgi:hypothetical protein
MKKLFETGFSGSQIEKNEDFILRVKWSKDQLWELVDKRMNYLFRKKYSKENVHFSDLFPDKLDSKVGTWNYMVDRTLLRPRDVINFTNFALGLAEGKASVSKNALLNAERSYSDNRRDALAHEWAVLFPGAAHYLSLLEGRPAYFELAAFCTTRTLETIFEALGSSPELMRDSIWSKLDEQLSEGGTPDPIALAQEVFHRLHLMGAVGLKTDQATPWQWFYMTHKPVLPEALAPGTKVEVHPMLHAALSIGARHSDVHRNQIWRNT